MYVVLLWALQKSEIPEIKNPKKRSTKRYRQQNVFATRFCLFRSGKEKN